MTERPSSNVIHVDFLRRRTPGAKEVSRPRVEPLPVPEARPNKRVRPPEPPALPTSDAAPVSASPVSAAPVSTSSLATAPVSTPTEGSVDAASPTTTLDAPRKNKRVQRAADGQLELGEAPETTSSTESESTPDADRARRDPTGDLYTRTEVARLFGIPESRLRYWESTGFLQPSGGVAPRQRYTFQDLISIRAAKGLLEKGTSLQKVRKCVDSLRRELPHVIRPLAELRVRADGESLLVETERARWNAESGQLLLDFDVRELRDEVVRALRPRQSDPSRRRAAYEAYLEGCRFDEEATTYERAETAYRRAILLDPELGHAYTNLGNLRVRRGDPRDAKVLYEKALSVDPAQPEALYNLGFLASDDGELEQAVIYFEQAIEQDRAFADAHFNLATVLEELGRMGAAKEHWRVYLSLDPEGAWAEVARRHLGRG